MTLDQRVQHLRHTVEELEKQHDATRKVLAQVIGAHNYFVLQQGFFARLRWLLFGPPTPKAQPPEGNAHVQR